MGVRCARDQELCCTGGRWHGPGSCMFVSSADTQAPSSGVDVGLVVVNVQKNIPVPETCLQILLVCHTSYALATQKRQMRRLVVLQGGNEDHGTILTKGTSLCCQHDNPLALDLVWAFIGCSVVHSCAMCHVRTAALSGPFHLRDVHDTAPALGSVPCGAVLPEKRRPKGPAGSGLACQSASEGARVARARVGRSHALRSPRASDKEVANCTRLRALRHTLTVRSVVRQWCACAPRPWRSTGMSCSVAKGGWSWLITFSCLPACLMIRYWKQNPGWACEFRHPGSCTCL